MYLKCLGFVFFSVTAAIFLEGRLLATCLLDAGGQESSKQPMPVSRKKKKKKKKKQQ